MKTLLIFNPVSSRKSVKNGPAILSVKTNQVSPTQHICVRNNLLCNQIVVLCSGENEGKIPWQLLCSCETSLLLLDLHRSAEVVCSPGCLSSSSFFLLLNWSYLVLTEHKKTLFSKSMWPGQPYHGVLTYSTFTKVQNINKITSHRSERVLFVTVYKVGRQALIQRCVEQTDPLDCPQIINQVMQGTCCTCLWSTLQQVIDRAFSLDLRRTHIQPHSMAENNDF